MCGVTGYFTASGSSELTGEDVWRAVSTLKLRGPDDRGVWCGENGIGLGQTRLSILDLSDRGHQPMRTDDGRLVMVFNGEVYNFAEIRAELSLKGHSFRGTGDSEVILAAFHEWGVHAAVARFVGMFAIALWDQQLKKLTLLRDRLGVKPLYYGWNGRTLWFGSELKALREYRHWRPAISNDALADYFRFSYIAAPRCIYKGIAQLEPGHALELVAGGSPTIERYWGLGESLGREWADDDDTLEQRLEALMSDAFNLRMISDVPVGVFLSGGIDSSIVTAMLKRDGPPVRTFTIGFDDSRFNEAPFAERVAQHLGTQHTTQIVREDDALRVLAGWGDLFDEPFGDASGIPTLLVSRLAAQHVKVVLSADGGDELFAGYSSYAAVASRMRSAQRHSPVVRAARDVAATLPWERFDALLAKRSASADPDHSRSRAMALRLRYLRETNRLTTPGSQFEHVLTSQYWHDGELSTLLGADFGRSRRTSDEYPGGPGEQMCRWDLDYYLSSNVLTKVDRTTMSLSIEGREPLLDHRLVEFAFSLPFHLRRGELGSKHLLRKVLYRHVPRELVDRPKAGFTPPIGRWMSGALRPLLDHHLGHRHVTDQGIFDPAMVRTVRQRFEAGDPYSVQRVWLLLAFQLWHSRWMSQTSKTNSNSEPAEGRAPLTESQT